MPSDPPGAAGTAVGLDVALARAVSVAKAPSLADPASPAPAVSVVGAPVGVASVVVDFTGVVRPADLVGSGRDVVGVAVGVRDWAGGVVGGGAVVVGGLVVAEVEAWRKGSGPTAAGRPEASATAASIGPASSTAVPSAAPATAAAARSRRASRSVIHTPPRQRRDPPRRARPARTGIHPSPSRYLRPARPSAAVAGHR